MVRRIGAMLLAIVLLAGSAAAELKWKDKTPGQKMLKAYIANVNDFLTEAGEMEINRIFEEYEKVAELGITSTEDAETPEDVTVTVYLYYDSIDSVLLRVNDPDRFPRIAAAFLRALSPKTMTQEQALKEPYERAAKAAREPLNSFRDTVEDLNGTAPRAYYAYCPNQHSDGVNWIELTIVFPLAEYWDEEMGVISGETPTKGPDTYSGNDKEYEGYFSGDDYDHLEVFTTATPEPDSAAAEYDDW